MPCGLNIGRKRNGSHLTPLEFCILCFRQWQHLLVMTSWYHLRSHRLCRISCCSFCSGKVLAALSGSTADKRALWGPRCSCQKKDKEYCSKLVIDVGTVTAISSPLPKLKCYIWQAELKCSRVGPLLFLLSCLLHNPLPLPIHMSGFSYPSSNSVLETEQYGKIWQFLQYGQIMHLVRLE